MEEKKELSYQEMNDLVDKLAIFFVNQLKIKVGDVIAIMSANSYKVFLIQYVCAKIGAIFSPLNAFYKSNDLDYILNLLQPKVFIIPGPNSPQELTINKFYDVLWKIRNSLPGSLKSIIFMDSSSSLSEVNKVKIYLFDQIIQSTHTTTTTTSSSSSSGSDSIRNLSNQFDPDSTCCIFFTSVSC